jgi:hypothetical protein
MDQKGEYSAAATRREEWPDFHDIVEVTAEPLM